MENKDWREEFDEKYHYQKGVELLLKSPNHFQTYDVTKGIISFIESLLKSKQEEIEKAIKSMKKNPKKDIVYCTSYELALDDLKPIISNLLK